MTPQPPIGNLIDSLIPPDLGNQSIEEDYSALPPERFLEIAEPELRRLIQGHINDSVDPEKVEQYANIRRN